MKIPKIIHRIWIPFTPENTKIPEEYLKLDKILKDLHPDWQFMEWDEQKLEILIKENFPEYFEIWKNYDQKTKQNDASRLFVVNHFGGVFLQHSLVFYKKIDNLIKGYDFIGFTQQENSDIIASAIFASIANHKILDMMIKDLPNTKDLHPLNATGPDFFTKNLKKYISIYGEKGIHILSHKFVFPFDWEQKNDPLINSQCLGPIETSYQACLSLFPDIYAYCLWKGSWLKFVK